MVVAQVGLGSNPIEPRQDLKNVFFIMGSTMVESTACDQEVERS